MLAEQLKRGNGTMLLPERFHSRCPHCGQTINLSTSAQLQAERLGVSCWCRHCSHEWILHSRREGYDHKRDGHPPHFATKLPAASADAEIPAPPTVFVVDDDPNVCRSLRFLMRSAGLEVESFLTAEEFLQTFEATSTGCLLLDLHLPGMGGIELQQKLLQIRCTIPIIFMTGRGDIAVAVQCLNRGAFDFFQKPIDPRVLLARVREAINSGSRNRQSEAPAAGSSERNVAPETWSSTNSLDAVARHEKHSGRGVPVV